MKIIIAPDSYKNCKSASEVAAALSRGIHSVLPDCNVVELPLADGGEGTLAALHSACGGEMFYFPVVDPLGRTHTGSALVFHENGRKIAVVEAAQCIGIELLTALELNPMKTSSAGLGMLITAVMKTISPAVLVVGLGGSASVDGGIGMLQAMGARLYDTAAHEISGLATGADLVKVNSMNLTEVLRLLNGCEIRILSDVNNFLCGEFGAARVFGPQKGASPKMVRELESAMFQYRQGLAPAVVDQQGDGAAGGLGFALRVFCGGKIVSGAEAVLHYQKFDQKIKDADVVITGEGCSDGQSACGKLCSVVARHCRQLGVPVVLASGALTEGSERLEDLFDGVFSIASGPGKLDAAMAATEQNLQAFGRNFARIFRLIREKKC